MLLKQMRQEKNADAQGAMDLYRSQVGHGFHLAVINDHPAHSSSLLHRPEKILNATARCASCRPAGQAQAARTFSEMAAVIATTTQPYASRSHRSSPETTFSTPTDASRTEATMGWRRRTSPKTTFSTPMDASRTEATMGWRRPTTEAGRRWRRLARTTNLRLRLACSCAPLTRGRVPLLRTQPLRLPGPCARAATRYGSSVLQVLTATLRFFLSHIGSLVLFAVLQVGGLNGGAIGTGVTSFGSSDVGNNSNAADRWDAMIASQIESRARKNPQHRSTKFY